MALLLITTGGNCFEVLFFARQSALRMTEFHFGTRLDLHSSQGGSQQKLVEQISCFLQGHAPKPCPQKWSQLTLVISSLGSVRWRVYPRGEWMVWWPFNNVKIFTILFLLRIVSVCILFRNFSGNNPPLKFMTDPKETYKKPLKELKSCSTSPENLYP